MSLAIWELGGTFLFQVLREEATASPGLAALPPMYQNPARTLWVDMSRADYRLYAGTAALWLTVFLGLGGFGF
jgi:hypothetical protein